MFTSCATRAIFGYFYIRYIVLSLLMGGSGANEVRQLKSFPNANVKVTRWLPREHLLLNIVKLKVINTYFLAN
ncbi:MAG: hypothetical protein Tsb0014_25850 [Pleurocapsa sp.]